MKGKLIVIDGIDGSGKETQTKILQKRLAKLGYRCKIADFPQYGQKSAGLVEEYLNGKYGQAGNVSPYQASIFYAVDRYDASFRIKKWLNQGYTVLANRYVMANMGHQGGKIKKEEARRSFYKWLYNLEFDIFKIPKPDLNIILHVKPAIASKLIAKKGKKSYIEGRKLKDIHSKDINHLKRADQTYLEVTKLFPKTKLIECTKNNTILPIKKINDKLWGIIKITLSS